MSDKSINITNILCPIDFSEYSFHALNYAKTLSQQFKSTLHLLHILPTLPFSQVPYHYHDDILDLEEKALLTAKEELLKVLKEKVPSELNSKWDVIKDDAPFSGIIEYSKNNNIDLIVMATHGYSGFKHAIFGSTTERVIRQSPCPILTVKHNEHDFVKNK